ncbi:hypothetical protein LXL04_032370 [Taraxacum kok-saghyz]
MFITDFLLTKLCVSSWLDLPSIEYCIGYILEISKTCELKVVIFFHRLFDFIMLLYPESRPSSSVGDKRPSAPPFSFADGHRLLLSFLPVGIGTPIGGRSLISSSLSQHRHILHNVAETAASLNNVM